MSLIPTDKLDAIGEMAHDNNRQIRLDELMVEYPSAAAADEAVRYLFERPIFNISHQNKKEKSQWARHDWMNVAANQGHYSWAHALLDHGADPSLMTEDGTWGGGQALREALDNKDVEPRWLERLWAMTDMKSMMQVLGARFTQHAFLKRYSETADKVALRVHGRPDTAEALEALYAIGGPHLMPRYAAKLAEDRAARALGSPAEAGFDRIRSRQRP